MEAECSAAALGSVTATLNTESELVEPPTTGTDCLGNLGIASDADWAIVEVLGAPAATMDPASELEIDSWPWGVRLFYGGGYHMIV